MIRTWGDCCGSILLLVNRFSTNLDKEFENFSQSWWNYRFDKYSELWEDSRNMRRCILEVKSYKTGMLIKNMFVYHFVHPWGWKNIWKTRGSRKRGYWFLNGGFRHFHTFALVDEKIFTHKLLFRFLVTKRLTSEDSINLPQIYLLSKWVMWKRGHSKL